MGNVKTADLFTQDTSISDDAKEMVRRKLTQIGKMLSFNVEKHEDGWVATCNEIDGLIAGNDNPTPSHQEIETHIREAIYATFGVEEFERTKSEPSPFFTFNEVQNPHADCSA